MAFKIIEGNSADVEKQLNELVANEEISITDVQYSTTYMQSDHKLGWEAEQMHGVLVRYHQAIKITDLPW